MYTKHCDETLCFHSEITHEIGFVNSKMVIIPFLSGFEERDMKQDVNKWSWSTCDVSFIDLINGPIINFNVVRSNVIISFFILGNDLLDWHNVRHDKRCNIMITQFKLVMLYNEWMTFLICHC